MAGPWVGSFARIVHWLGPAGVNFVLLDLNGVFIFHSDPALPRAQEAQRERGIAGAAARHGANHDESGYATRDAKRARRLLENPARRLEDLHPGAAASLREGLDETLTVMRLRLPENLERVLSSTNLIENLFSRGREIGRRVKRWQSGTMVLRWSAAGVLDTERGFRKIVGYRTIPISWPPCALTMPRLIEVRSLTMRRKLRE